jgi:tetratricopeptide (TPR) repeat protein
VILAFLSFAYRLPTLSAAYANLGAVSMARQELSSFPSGVWDDGSTAPAIAPAAELFQQALRLNPGNRTAHHRLGLIAMLQRDFPVAINHLESAHALDPDHRGIRKALGYSYVWAGQPERAIPMLAPIPEAEQELSVYIRWWETQNRPDLSDRAQAAGQMLAENK